MDYVLFTVAILIIWMSGMGIIARVIHPCRLAVAEWLAFAALAGSLFISTAVFIVSSVASPFAVVATVTVAGLAVATLGFLHLRRIGSSSGLPLIVRKGGRDAAIVVLLQLLVTGWIVHCRGMGWDALYVWDIKARAFFTAGGIPFDYFADPTRTWSHQNYPLLVPLTKYWTYLWLSDPHQMFGKYLTLFFYLPVIPLLFHTTVRLTGVRWNGYIAALMPIALPLAMVGEGSATSGYADIPVGVFYFAAIASVLLAVRNEAPAWLRFAGLMAAGVAWTKQEGQILWIAFAAIAVAVILSDPKLRMRRTLYAWALAPGLTVLIGWRLFLAWSHARNGGAYVPVTLATFITNRRRIPEIIVAIIREFGSWEHWSILWLLFLVGSIVLWRRYGRAVAAILFAAVVLPVPAYVFVYIFSAWNPYMSHVTSSIPRLVLQLAFPAVLGVATAVPFATPQPVVIAEPTTQDAVPQPEKPARRRRRRKRR